MKKFLISIILLADIVLCRAYAAPKGTVLEDLQITVINEELKVESTHRPQGTKVLAKVALGKDERCVMSATLKGLPAKGEIVGYTTYKNDDNRFIFGKQNIDGQYYMVIYRVHRGVEILQERTLIPRKAAKRPIYLRMTSKNGRVRYYYSFNPLDRWENTGWIRLGIMEGWIAGSKKNGKMEYDFGLYGGKALVQELGPHKAKAWAPMDTALVCKITSVPISAKSTMNQFWKIIASALSPVFTLRASTDAALRTWLPFLRTEFSTSLTLPRNLLRSIN